MATYRKRTFSGVVCEIEYFNAPESRSPSLKPKLETVRTDEERRTYNRKKSLKHFTRIINTNFDSSAYYCTLTYSNSNLPATFAAAEKCLENYIRRLRRTNPQARIIAVTGYGKRSGRLHHHLIVTNASEADILNKWTNGEIKRAEHLRRHNFYNGTDHGEDFTALAAYLHAHTPDSVKGRRWRQTKNLVQPISEKPKKLCRAYSEKKLPKAPEGFMLVDVKTSEYFGSGYINFKYVRIPCEELNYNRYSKKAKKVKTEVLKL